MYYNMYVYIYIYINVYMVFKRFRLVKPPFVVVEMSTFFAIYF